MHLLAATPGIIDDGTQAINLGQSPGDIIILTAADTEIASLAQAQATRLNDDPDAPVVRAASLLHLSHNYSIDLYLEETVASARLVILRLLGGRGYWPYGVEQLCALCREKSIQLALLPGDDQPDAELTSMGNLRAEQQHRLWQYFVHGGVENAENLLRYASDLIGRPIKWQEPVPLLRAGIYYPGLSRPGIKDLPWKAGRPVAALTFYRALMQATNTGILDQMIVELDKAGLNALPIYCASLKDPVGAATVSRLLQDANVSVILNATSFALSTPGAEKADTPFDQVNGPVVQMVFSGGNAQDWREKNFGLSPRDIAMNVALPEVDGRLLSRAVSFKGLAERDPNIEADIIRYQPRPDRCRFVARLAANWAMLRKTPADARKIALVLANYPNRDGRLGNGVGLDTPAGVLETLKALKQSGYTFEMPFANSDQLIQHIMEGPTNAGSDGREIREILPRRDYENFFNHLPARIRREISERWGALEKDPFFLPDRDAFALPLFILGNLLIGLQPARGYNIDPVKSYHDPDLIPPHNYLAFYAFIRRNFAAQALVHFGKHGNLEWLPGKSLALSRNCYPEAVFGPLPHLYPFIVNDPGEGTQAKRRSQAVIIDHMTPPLTRAESYGPLKDLEALIDEYFEAAGVDPRRVKILKQEILNLARHIGLDREAGVRLSGNDSEALAQLDNYLCELKEMQIRDGLHIFGLAPEGEQLRDLLVALVRIPRHQGKDGDASLPRALCTDFNFPVEFDPLNCKMTELWNGPKPDLLNNLTSAPWRSNGDTVERLEILSQRLVTGEVKAPGSASEKILETLNRILRPNVENCGRDEINGLQKGLAGEFVQPGASGAPTRGRPDILPTGRNFYSVDTRTIPTPAAWKLGWKSAQQLMETHAQTHGNFPKRLALSAWGTANMRTGGDDIAQVLALMGVQPAWDKASRRVTGFEIMPLGLLDRPRVDVTLRISGFFRDAFPGVIDLIDSAARAVAALDEAESDNPLAASKQRDAAALIARGVDAEEAAAQAGARVFGSMPGAYGAGLQALMDENGWQDETDLARAYLVWGGYRYGKGADGRPAQDLFERRLTQVEAVLHNQDNREHDLLDSDDYYQFEGGMTAAIRVLSGRQPHVYHNDHSRPENPRIRTLEDEIGRVIRARVVNPKWINGVMRHGYKGAFEMAATVDYMVAFAATAQCVQDHHFDMVFDAYLGDDTVRGFIEKHNPEALKDIADRLQEALKRQLWRPRRNDLHHRLALWGRTCPKLNEKF